MAEFTPRSSLIELGIGKVAEIAGGLTNLEVIRVLYVLVAIGAVRFLTFDLIFLEQMRLVNKSHLFGELDFFGLKIVVRFAMASGGRTAVVYDSGYGPYGAATQFKKRDMTWCPKRDVAFLGI